MDTSQLPALNAVLNATCAVFLLMGFGFVRTGRIEAHKKCMGAALLVSVLFLVSYLYYHYYHGSTKFQGQGWIRPVYFAILISHTLLAGIIVPLACITVFRALKNQIEKHRKIARITFPLWLYVSVTGVVIYWMLYHT
ncbi:MAG: DUF420 domain-containing protein [Candidatus Omnitrophica bacterium]|nr:DUF420 domain-containing protein [Candidatus Omnitrophota bacterium]